ncbi:hypothetical protein BC833DRAFT_522574 [Globomyces pollinis-pini]|nr:hypothetical protein BC833DRAFT_522574 [Globomyces pollinis-pini]
MKILHPLSPNGQFKHGLFDCFKKPTVCALSCCCPCIVYGQNQATVKGSDSCLVDSIIYLAVGLLGCHSCLGAVGRGHVRDARGITGAFTGDCCMHFCCGPCALTQERVELDGVGQK